MSLLSRLFKPAWQHDSASRRLLAVQESRDPALLAALPSMATTDANARVRRAALQRLGDLGLWGDRSRHDSDGELRADARRQYINGLIAAAGNQLAEAERLLRVEESVEVLEAIAARASASPLRRMALERIERPGLLADCALSDPDAETRLWLVERLQTEAALRRVAEQSRTRDKRVHRAAREKLEALRLAGGDRDIAEQRAQTLCSELEHLLHRLPVDGLARVDAIEQQWQQLPLAGEPDWQRRISGLLATTRTALSAGSARAPQPDSDDEPGQPPAAAEQAEPAEPVEAQSPAEPAEAAIDAADEASAESAADGQSSEPPAPPAAPVLDPLLLPLQMRIDEARACLAEEPEFDLGRIAAEFERHAQADSPITGLDALKRQLEGLQRQQQRLLRGRLEQEAEALLPALQQSIQAQQALPASQALARLDELKAQLGGLPRSIRAELAELRSEARKLIDWQRWSNNEIRKRLCDEVEAMPASGLHPDAIATRIRELQAEWARIDALEGIDPKDPRRGLAKRFHALVHQVLKPARPYFEKRAELRRERTELLSGQTEAIEQSLAAAGQDRRALQALRRQLSESLRQLDDIDPRQRRALGQRLRADLALVDQQMARQSERVELSKRQLIAELRRDLAALPPEQRPDRAKQAQAAWKALGQGDRRRDQQQWVELRELVDPIFLDVEAAKVADREEAQARRARLDAICAGIESALAEGEPHAQRLQQVADHSRAQLAELAPLERSEEQRSDRLLQQLQSRLAQAERQQRLAGYAALATRAARLDRIEQAWLRGDGLDREALAELVNDPPLSDPALHQALAGRRERLLALAGEDDEAPMARVLDALEAQHRQASGIVLECEFHAGVESPVEERQARMDLQVRKLAERMSGGQAANPAHDATRLWAAWYGCGPMEAATRQQLSQRFAACRAGLEAALAG